MRTADHGWVRALITDLQGELVILHLWDHGETCQLARRLLKTLEEQFSRISPFCINFQQIIEKEDITWPLEGKQKLESLRDTSHSVNIQVTLYIVKILTSLQTGIGEQGLWITRRFVSK